MRIHTSLLTLVALLFILPTTTTTAQTIWTGGAGTDAWCDAANWDAGVPTASTDAFVRGGASVYPEIDGTEACTVEARNLHINDDNSGGQIIVTGGTLDVLSFLYTKNSGVGTGLRLEGGQVSAAAMDLYGDHSGRFSGGELTLDNSNTRVYGVFRPAGTLVRFNGGPQLPGVFFANPGTGPGQSFFEDLVVEGVGVNILSGNGGVNGTAWVTGTLTLVSGTLTGGTISGKPRLVSPASVGADPILFLTTPFTVSGLNVNGLEVQKNGRLIFEGGGCIRLDNTTFSVFSATEPRLTIRHPGGNLELNNLSFDTTPNNIHLATEDTSPGNAYRLNLHVVNPTPNTATEGTNYTETGGAEVLWDGPALAPLPVTLLLEPADVPPVTVPATGGPLTYRATLTNTSSESQTFKAKIVAILPSGSVFGPIQGPRTVRIPAGQTIGPVSFTDNVPAIAPPGTYGVVLEGTTVCPEATPTPDGFTFEKESSDTTQARMPSLAMLRAAWVGDERLDWTVTPSDLSEATEDEEDDAAASGTVLPNVFMLHTAYPNPFRRAAVLRLDVPTASIVRVEVYDRLGRRVAVVHDGPLEAGTHQFRLETATLPSGLYIVRATNGRTAFTQRVTIVR